MYSLNSDSKVASGVVLSGATVAALLLAAETSPGFWVGIAFALATVLYAARTSWLLLLCLFPLAFAIRPAPDQIGVQEVIFALIATGAILLSVAESIAANSWREALRIFGLPAGMMGGLVVINAYVALSHAVSLTDWLRGLIPFVFLLLAIPLTICLREKPDRLPWLGLATVLLGVLMAGHVVFTFFNESLYQPYWLQAEGASIIRIPESASAMPPDVLGPFWDRVTMHSARATTVVLPVGLVAAFVVAGRAHSRVVSAMALGLAILFLAAILMTLTRSMLLAALSVMCVVMLATILWWRRMFARYLILLVVLMVSGWGMVQAMGLESLWNYRMYGLIEAADAHRVSASISDDNVISRMDELKIAWERFIDHPVFGNGLGNKHTMTFIWPEGVMEKQVAYVHNWPAYFLMATGFTGWVVYAALLFGPVLFGMNALRHEPMMITAMRAGVLAMAAYGLFFAVFRLIDFNLILAAAWAMVLAQRMPRAGAT